MARIITQPGAPRGLSFAGDSDNFTALASRHWGDIVAAEAARVVTLRPAAGGAVRYERHRPETTPLYPLVEKHYPVFLDTLAAQGRSLPGYVQQEFAAYLKCGRLDHGFLRVRCALRSPWRGGGRRAQQKTAHPPGDIAPCAGRSG